MAEGESFVLAGGALSQRGMFPAWQVALAAFGGSTTMDQTCFALGRWFRDWRWVRAVREKRALKTALGFVERHPNGYILAFRYLYGLRIVSPLAIGLTKIGWLRFMALNTFSAAVWAVAFTALGVFAGDAIDKMFGRVHSGLVLLLIILVLAGASSALVHHVVAKRTAKDTKAAEA
ncbi:membrane protein DedA with SNARE-associated domain [Sphingomonas vulcanisoli]|uniref:Membrane protein DedA with SNARE-associated domain n=1 Tax=Sphingomonas vulcanisoli TaxID=1658060 RepID=A0ABX0TLN0_9SPHN|nr:DedA family protein [Sphingomonas vulcanisoli]NIJ06433.1 membrane protein DedA with SNARE-associated domain [Sphingomonas vulcanisoli]